ncbi:hypothetical protein J7E63_15960 [Bacillus sp. ISL-75]|nr:hypothetical protein [Bacillus sp. ISL-75]
MIDTEKVVLGSLQKVLMTDYDKVVPLEDLYFVLGIPVSKSLSQLGISDVDRANDRK